MYLSSEWLALANQAIRETFESTCIAWQAIPHWDTGDPAQSAVPAEDVNTPTAPTVVSLVSLSIPFDVTLATALYPTPDSLLNLLNDRTVELAADVDEAVIPALSAKGFEVSYDESSPDQILDDLIDARARIEQQGYRAPSCLITDTAGLKSLSKLVSGCSILSTFMDAANVNSLHRADGLDDPKKPPKTATQGILLGRRQRIPHGGGASASSGEEPVDLAVSVPPGLEVVGENGANNIALAIRIRYALRIKDSNGLVSLRK